MRVLAGDIGGTNTRLVIAEVSGARVQVLTERRYASGQYAGLAEILRAFGSDAGCETACFAVAGPIQHDGERQFARITNLPWQIDSESLTRELHGARVRLINDFQAVGYGIEALTAPDLVTLQAGRPVAHGPRAVLGAGTGLGQTVCVWQGDHYEALPTEGGHAHFAPTSGLEDELLRHQRKRHGRVSCERILSGGGLVQIYEFLKQRGEARESPDVAAAMRAGDPGAAISDAALARRDALCGQALDLFVRIYGAHAGDLALSVLATGGVYLAGGIAPKIIARLRDGEFLRAFNDKGRMAPLVQAMPVHVVMNESVGLLGAALTAAR
jgi:glucokinase